MERAKMNNAYLLAITLILAMPYTHGMEYEKSESSSSDSSESSSYEEKDNDNDHVTPDTTFEYSSAVTALKFDDVDDDNFTILTGHENGDLIIDKKNDGPCQSHKADLKSSVSALCSAGSINRKGKYREEHYKVFAIGTPGGTVHRKEFEKTSLGIAYSKATNEKKRAILSPVMALTYDSNNGRVISGHLNGKIYFFTKTTFAIEHSLSTDSAIVALGIDPQSKELASGHEDGTVNIYDLKDYSLNAEGNLESPIMALEFNPQPKKKELVIGHPDGTIRIYSGSKLEDYRTVDSGSGLLTLCFNPNGTSFATGYSNGTVLIRSSSNPSERIAKLTKSTSPVTALTYDRSGTHLAVGGEDELCVYKTFKLWKKSLHRPKNAHSSTAKTSEKDRKTENGKEEKKDEEQPPSYAGYSPEYHLPSAPPEKNKYAISYLKKPPQKKKLSPVLKEEKKDKKDENEDNRKSEKKKKSKCTIL